MLGETMPTELNGCLVSQEIRDLLERGQILTAGAYESRIQPASLDAIIGDEVFVLDNDTHSLFKPRNTNETVYRNLLELPAPKRRAVSIVNGYELKRGSTYLVPLEERVRLGDLACIRSSPKSTTGRIFLNTRMIADYGPHINEVVHSDDDRERMLWLQLQPLAFNVIVYPGISLSQLRFLTSLDAQLPVEEARRLQTTQPFLFYRTSGGLVPTSHSGYSEGLDMHLDLSGVSTEGIGGLRARRNPDPLDLSKKNNHKPEEYFEPLKADAQGEVIMRHGEYYLFSTKEVLNIPSDLCVETVRHSAQFTGSIEFAGFIDNGFLGDLVLEPRSDEIADMTLTDGMAIGALKVFRTHTPDKLYGEGSGASYKGQFGPRTAKFFRGFDFGHAAKNYDKLDREVLVQDARVLQRYHTIPQGFEFMDGEHAEQLFTTIRQGFTHSRYHCETDERVLQPIPYVILFGPDRTVFSYVRSSDIQQYGDKRLFGNHSLGVGGHIQKKDGPHFIDNCIQREVFREEMGFSEQQGTPQFMGTLYCTDREVDRVHFGLVYALHTVGDMGPIERSIASWEMKSLDDLLSSDRTAYEVWSQNLIPHLPELYRRSI